jgi:hypothetical protein
MTPMLSRARKTEGFALPTVILASVIMLIVLTVSVTAVGSITTTLAGQYYNQLAREAAESGLAHARACLRASPSYTATWTNALPLKPNTDCSGATLGVASQWIATPTNARSTYSVPAPTTGASGSIRVAATGMVELTRASNASQVWRTYATVAAENSRYNDTPQIASGAGWKQDWHNGYLLASNGTLYGWGDNSAQQLGPASLGAIATLPVKITPPDGITFVRRVFNSGQGASILCILGVHNTLGDQVYCRGVGGFLVGTDWQRLGLAGGLTALDAAVNGYGLDSMCVKASDLQAYCVGLNDSGGLGNASGSPALVPISAPTKFRLDLANPGPTSGSAASLTVKGVFSQDRYSCVVASDDQAYCAGDNNYGQLGQNNFTTNVWVGKSVPGRALIPGSPQVVDIRLPYHTGESGIYYQTAAGDIYMSGNNYSRTANDGGPGAGGSCPVDSNTNCYITPKFMTTGYSKIISVGEEGGSRGGICVVAAKLQGDSGLWCIGSANTYGEIGISPCGSVYSSWWGPANLLTNIASPTQNIEANYQMNSVMIKTENGDVYAAGDNTYGKLGTGTAFQACNPTYAKVALPVGVKALAIANGDEYSAFILGDNGKLYAMGRNHLGQLGDGTTTNRNTPVEVKIPRQETVY